MELPTSSASDSVQLKMKRRSQGGLSFDIEFNSEAADNSQQQQHQHQQRLRSPLANSGQLNTSAIAEPIESRLLAAERRRQRQLAERVDKLETHITNVMCVAEKVKAVEKDRSESQLKAVEETLKAAEERRLSHVTEVQEKARVAATKVVSLQAERQQELDSAKQQLEAELEKDIKEKENRRKEKLEMVKLAAQKELAKVEVAKAQRASLSANNSLNE